MNFELTATTLLLAAAACLAVWLRKLTPLAGLTGLASAIMIFLGTGFTGLACMTVFFVCGVLATSLGLKEKAIKGIAEEGMGRRKSSQVLANSVMATLASLAAFARLVDPAMSSLLVAAAFSSATADTLSSELGNIYGKRYYNILSFKPDARGLDGVVSLEGTLAGMGGSLVIALISFAFNPTPSNILIIVVAGTAGNLADSVFGAAWERKGKIGNDAVNFLNTLVGVCTAYFLVML
jgi:uncharacterized protein (TIGR00297 family)